MKTARKAATKISHEFVHSIPAAPEMEEETLYISVRGMTAIHKCFCGCGAEVVTPLSPAGWELRYDGETVSLYPSVGSGRLPCRSHYWVRRDRVLWTKDMSDEAVVAARRRDNSDMDAHFNAKSRAGRNADAAVAPTPERTPAWKRTLRLIGLGRSGK